MNTNPSESAHVQARTFGEKTRSLIETVGEDYRDASLKKKLGLWVTAAWLAYEWGPGNETFTPVIASQVMNHTEGVQGALATGLIAGGFTAGQQIASGYAMASSAEAFGGLTQKTLELSGVDEEGNAVRKSFGELQEVTKTGYAVFLGSSFVVAREAALTGNTEQKHLRKQAGSSALRSSAVVAALTGGASGGVDAAVGAAQDTRLERPVELAVGAIESPMTWLGIATVALTAGHVRNRRNKSRN